jgi:hypothetical protein
MAPDGSASCDRSLAEALVETQQLAATRQAAMKNREEIKGCFVVIVTECARESQQCKGFNRRCQNFIRLEIFA